MRTNFSMERFSLENNYITMVRGNTLSFGMKVTDADEVYMDVDAVAFAAKKNYTDTDYIFYKTLGDGITRTDTGRYVVRLAPADTNDVEPGKYFYNLDIGANDDEFTISQGVLQISQDVIRGGIV